MRISWTTPLIFPFIAALCCVSTAAEIPRLSKRPTKRYDVLAKMQDVGMFPVDTKTVAVATGQKVQFRRHPFTDAQRVYETGLEHLALLALEGDSALIIAGTALTEGDKTIQRVNKIDRDSGKTVWSQRTLDDITGLELSPRGDVIAVSGGTIDDGSDGVPVGAVQLIDASTGKCVNTLRGTSRHLATAIDFSPDGSQLAVGHFGDATVAVWDLDSGKESVLFRSERHAIADSPAGWTDLEFSQDGPLLIACGGCDLGSGRRQACRNGILAAWNMPEQRLALLYTDPRLDLFQIDVSPDGDWFLVVGTNCPEATGRDPRTLFMAWDTAKLAPMWRRTVPGSHHWPRISENPDVLFTVETVFATDGQPRGVSARLCEWNLRDANNSAVDEQQ